MDVVAPQRGICTALDLDTIQSVAADVVVFERPQALLVDDYAAALVVVDVVTTQPRVGARSSWAMWKKIALPAPGTTGSML